MTVPTSPDPPHFDGPAVSGGYAWPVATVSAAPPARLHPTGVTAIDEATGGVGVGEVWTASGEAGSGVTALVTALAGGAARSAAVVIANGHVPTRALANRLSEIADDIAARVSVTSWLRVPWLSDDAWTLGDADIVVLDTFDEMWRPPHWERSPEQRIADARWLRELARRAGTAVVLTQRRPVGVPRTPIDALFDDVADVRLDVCRSRHRGALDLTVNSRRGTPWRGPVRVG